MYKNIFNQRQLDPDILHRNVGIHHMPVRYTIRVKVAAVQFKDVDSYMYIAIIKNIHILMLI